MPTEVLRPNGTITNLLTTITGGAGSAHASLADDADGTYIGTSGLTTGGLISEFDLTTFTIGTGRVKTVTAIVRARYTASTPTVLGASLKIGGVEYGYTGSDLTAAFANYSGSTTALPPVTQAQINAATGTLRGQTGEVIDPEVAELSLSVVYATAPVVVVNAPDGEITGTNQPMVEWTHTPGTDGGPQTRFAVKVFTAAQVAAGGFSVDTTEPVSQSGPAVPSHVPEWDGVSPLVDGSYVVYVRTAQLADLGTPHWSEWASETFSIAVDTSDVSTVVGVATDAQAKITVTVTRDGTSEAWDAVEVQRQVGSGPWEPVRGATNVDATGHATEYVVVDHEAPNGASVKYRARATRFLSGLPITGAFVESTAVQWDSDDAWLKNPADPTKNLLVKIRELSQADTPIRQGVHEVLGRARPVVISDVRVSDRGSFVVQTATMAAARSLVDLLDSPFLLLQFPPDWDVVPSRHVATAMIGRARLEQRAGNEYMLHPIGYHEIDAPSDPTVGTGLP